MIRLRRLRNNETVRNMIRETSVSVNDLVYPVLSEEPIGPKGRPHLQIPPHLFGICTGGHSAPWRPLRRCAGSLADPAVQSALQGRV